MAEKRKSLGRGLDALLGGAAQEQEKPNPKSLNELAIFQKSSSFIFT